MLERHQRSPPRPSNSWPTSASASRWFGETRNGSASTPSRSGSPSRVEHGPHAAPVEVADRLGVEGLVDAARQRARRTRRSRRRGRGSGASRAASRAPRSHLRPPLVDLGVRARGRVDDRGRRARLVADADEVVEDRLGGQLLDDARARPAAGEAGGDDRHVEPLQRARDVDPLAAGERQRLRSRGAAGRAGSSARSACGRSRR